MPTMSEINERGFAGIFQIIQETRNPRLLSMTIPVSETTMKYFVDLANNSSKAATKKAGAIKQITPENAAAIWIEQQITELKKRVAAGEKPLP